MSALCAPMTAETMQEEPVRGVILSKWGQARERKTGEHFQSQRQLPFIAEVCPKRKGLVPVPIDKMVFAGIAALGTQSRHNFKEWAISEDLLTGITQAGNGFAVAHGAALSIAANRITDQFHL